MLKRSWKGFSEQIKLVVSFIKKKTHPCNTQYFSVGKTDKFSLKKIYINIYFILYLFFAQNNDCGYMLDYLCSKNKDPDELCSYCTADLGLCFRLCILLTFLCDGILLFPV